MLHHAFGSKRIGLEATSLAIGGIIMPKKLKTVDMKDMEEMTVRYGITNQTADGITGPIYNST